MFWLYSICAAVGGTVLVCQFLLTLTGLTDMGDIPDDLPDDPGIDVSDIAHGTHHVGHGNLSTWLFGMITFRTIVAALAFFGLSGLTAQAAGISAPLAMAIAVAAGLASMFFVHWIMQTLYELRADGTVRIDRAVGQPATVYLRIPGGNSGQGKVTVMIRGRSVEFNAKTAGEALPTGATVAVTGILNSDTVEVEPAGQIHGVQHA